MATRSATISAFSAAAHRKALVKIVIVDALAAFPSLRAQRFLAVIVRLAWRGFCDC